jgi:(4S)-4-hydroxy-5-phosphonooxypentane-2,3-dione isomerase
MIATLVHVHVKAEFLKEFLEETRSNHEASIKEPGNVRFDILQDDMDPCKFTFYEVYLSDDAIAAHKLTSHYHRWREVVEPWMAQSRKGVRHTVLHPVDLKLW